MRNALIRDTKPSKGTLLELNVFGPGFSSSTSSDPATRRRVFGPGDKAQEEAKAYQAAAWKRWGEANCYAMIVERTVKADCVHFSVWAVVVRARGEKRYDRQQTNLHNRARMRPDGEVLGRRRPPGRLRRKDPRQGASMSDTKLRSMTTSNSNSSNTETTMDTQSTPTYCAACLVRAATHRAPDSVFPAESADDLVCSPCWSRIDTLALRCSRYERLAAEALRMLGHLDTAQMSTGDYVEAARKAMGQIRDGA